MPQRHAYTLAQTLALFAISSYRQFISPYKGFSCAYRIHSGGRSCSELGYRAIRRFGIVTGFGVLRQRLRRCSVVYQQHHNRYTYLNRQQGFCDAGCDVPCDVPCELPDLHFAEIFRYCDCSGCSGCDFSSGNDKSKSKPRKTKPLHQSFSAQFKETPIKSLDRLSTHRVIKTNGKQYSVHGTP